MDDYSKYDFPNPIWYILPTWEVSLKVGTFVPIIIFGIIGNILLLNIILRNRGLRTPTNLIIANMAVADLLTIITCPVMFMVHDFFQNYQLGVVGCKTEGFLECAFLVTAVLNLAVVSYDRLTAIVLPQETRLTHRGAKICIVVTWLSGVTIALPLLIFRYYKQRIWRNFLEIYCTENPTVLPMYWHVIISALVWFPLAVMLICYSAIFWKLDRYEKQILKRENPIAVSYKTRVAKMLFIVVLTFIALRLPFTALIFIRNQIVKGYLMNSIDSSFKILWYSSHYLIFFNAAINPVIYGLTNDNFRRAYSQMPLFRSFCKTNDKTEKKPLNQNMVQGSLEPRGPCGEEKLSITGVKWFWFKNQKQTSSLNTATSTNTTPIQSTKFYKNNNKNTEVQFISTTRIRDDSFSNSDDFIIKEKNNDDYSEFI